jgi:hypothetical protein
VAGYALYRVPCTRAQVQYSRLHISYRENGAIDFFAVVNHFIFLSRLVAIHLVHLYLYMLQGTEQKERTRVPGTRDIERHVRGRQGGGQCGVGMLRSASGQPRFFSFITCK